MESPACKCIRRAIETAYALKQLVTAGVRVFFYLENRERTLDSPTTKHVVADHVCRRTRAGEGPAADLRREVHARASVRVGRRSATVEEPAHQPDAVQVLRRAEAGTVSAGCGR